MSADPAAARTGAPSPEQTLPLAGVRVIDLTHMLAGPYCTWLLGALGADVIKIEMPGRGDFSRSIAPFLDEQSIYFLSLNRNKRSCTLDLKRPEGHAALLRLVAQADVLVENNRPGVMARLKLDYASLSSLYPRLVYASISGFGQTGPYSHQPAFDAVIQAMAGTMSITGEEGGGPVRVGTSIGDMGAGLFAVVGILSALQQRGRTGRGGYVDVAMLDAQLALLENAVARYMNTGEVPRRLGSRHPLVTPFQAFPTRDEPIVVCVDTEAQWERLCTALQRPDLMGDPRFTDANARTRHHADLEPLLSEVFRARDRAYWIEVLQRADVPVSPINSIAEAVAHPQIAARAMIATAGAGRFVAQPIRTSAGNPWPERPAPRLGEHTEDVLREAGLTGAEIQQLRQAAAI